MITNIIIIISACICAFFINALFTITQGILAKYQLSKLKKNEILKFKLKKIHEFTYHLFVEYSQIFPELSADILTNRYMNDLIKNKHLINEKYDFIKRLKEVV